MDLNHIYGHELERQHKLRLFKDGKLQHQVGEETLWLRLQQLQQPQTTATDSSVQIIDGEVYPPTVKDVSVDMHYPPHIPESERFAVGHEAFGLVPGLMMYATIWLREHNRVCDVLKEAHPDWDDERLFQTTRLILIGEFRGSSSQVIAIRGSKQKPSLVTLLSHWKFQKRNCALVIMQILLKSLLPKQVTRRKYSVSLKKAFCFS